MLSDNIKKLILKSFLEDLTKGEKKQLSEWINKEESNHIGYHHLKDQFESGEIEANWQRINLNKNWNNIKRKADKGSKSVTFEALLRYAAVAAILLVAFIQLYPFKSAKQIKNEGLQTLSYELPDHSKVWLRPNTVIRFVEDGFKSNRSISLDGEAFFEVEKDDVPFIVLAGKAEVEVLGTTFDLVSNDTISLVRLVEGSVRFSSDKGQVILQPGEQAALAHDRLSKISNHNPNIYGWKTGEFQFYESPLDEVMETIAPYYGLSISISDDKKDVLVTSSFSQLSIEEVVQELGYILDIEIELVNQSLIIN